MVRGESVIDQCFEQGCFSLVHRKTWDLSIKDALAIGDSVKIGPPLPSHRYLELKMFDQSITFPLKW